MDVIDPALLPVSDHLRALRALAPVDAVRYAEGTRDPLVRQFGHLPESEYTPESVDRLARTVVPSGLARGDLAVLSIVDVTDDTFLGSLVLFDVTATEAEVGFWLHPESRRGGHATGALELAAQLAAGSGLDALTARTLTGNVASQRNLERSGFQFVEQVEDRTPAQELVPLLHYRRPLTAPRSRIRDPEYRDPE
ncbi:MULTISPECIES: GNAT family N-acetyltransferase [Prauserella salsuginis group]|uniref:GNAT family N-acetyltransferase n=1 Tax=Prauserella salsuginis group TaxID=2893672 RepID=UPI002164D965|nr:MULTISPECIES: GNAT family N-acetyltransferase [Prauserella salsuginis group]MCR3721337.1 Protein N-acetyltransferase, RimJ/RimL family [Prauserella flava]MCR3734583.1 Protein N-acetyltransferase, RimJ/RimL family [Prauserella salsuginis]